MNYPNQREEQEDDTSNHHSPYCPSFSTYTTDNRIAMIATRVVAAQSSSKLYASHDGEFDYFHDDNCEDDDEDDFEFATIPEEVPVYPVFDRELLRDLGSQETAAEANIQLKSLFFAEDQLSLSSSIVEDLESVPPETYCLWAPKSPGMPSPSRCVKSSSTGSGPAPPVSRTWRLRNLLRRSKSDGKEGLMLVTSKKGKDKTDKEKAPLRPSPPASPSRSYYGSSSSKEKETKRRTYLPYKQDLLGFFGSPQTLRRINIPPF